MKVKDLIEQLKTLPENSEVVITDMGDKFCCSNFEVHSPYKDGQAQEIILGTYITDYGLEEDE